MSFKYIRALLSAAIGHTPVKGYTSIEDVWPDKVVYTTYDGDKGATYECAYTIDVDGKATLGTATEVRPVTSYEPVVFSGIAADAAIFADSGTHPARIFKIGKHPSHDFEMTPEEADAAVAAFTPVPIFYEHGKSPLKWTKFGEVEDIRREGDWIVGTTRFLDSARQGMKGVAAKLSASWDRATKTLGEVSVVGVPGVAEAGLVAAFSGSGPVPTAKEATPARNEPAMKDFFLKLFRGHTPTDAEVAEFSDKLSAIDDIGAVKAETAETKAENTRLMAEIEALKVSSPASFNARSAAERIVAKLKSDRRLTPAEEPDVLAEFTAAIAATPVTFSTAGDLVESDFVKALKASYERRDPHRFDTRITAAFAVEKPAEVKPIERIDNAKVTANFNALRSGKVV